MSILEIVYNIISFVFAVVMVVVFTIYAKRALNKIEEEENIDKESHQQDVSVGVEMENVPQERHNNSSLV